MLNPRNQCTGGPCCSWDSYGKVDFVTCMCCSLTSRYTVHVLSSSLVPGEMRKHQVSGVRKKAWVFDPGLWREQLICQSCENSAAFPHLELPRFFSQCFSKKDHCSERIIHDCFLKCGPGLWLECEQGAVPWQANKLTVFRNSLRDTVLCFISHATWQRGRI